MLVRTLVILCLLCGWATASVASSWDLFKKGDYNAAYRSAYIKYKIDKNAEGIDLFVIGRVYLEGLGVSDKDSAEALAYFNKAISIGSTQAALFLAKTYEQGQKIEKSAVSALQYYKIAAEMGEPNLEETIAKLATQISGEAVSASSCPEILDAANKGKEDFYILAVKCYGLAKAETSIYQHLLLKAFERASYKDGGLILDLLLDKTIHLYSPSFALQIVAGIPDNNSLRDAFFDKVFTKLHKHMSDKDLAESLSTLHEAFVDDEDLQPQIVRLLRLAFESRSSIAPKIAVNYLAEELESSFNTEVKLQIIKSLLATNAVDSDSKKSIVDIIIAEASEFVVRNRENSEAISKYAGAMMEDGLCGPAKIIFDTKKFSVALQSVKSIARLEGQCLDVNFDTILMAFSNFPNSNEQKVLFALKDLCASGSKNSCHALGLTYLKNVAARYDQEEANQYAQAAFETGVAAGSADSAFQLATYYTKKGQKERAIKFARIAYERGLVEGLYAEGVVRLKGFFSTGEARCKPLLRFLVEAKINNQYYEEARALRKKKKCKD